MEINNENLPPMHHFDPTSPENGTLLTVLLAGSSLAANLAQFDTAITPVVHLIQGAASLAALVIGLITIQRMLFGDKK